MNNIQNKELQPIMVSIQCTAYNHERFIRETLEGFVMQKTNFSFEAIVHDDASTDGTAKIIREYAEKYPDIIKPIYETENQYSKKDGSLLRIMNDACRGKYIAFCEGDDYWIDPYKLQKQVDILEKDNSIAFVYSKVNVYDELKKQFIYEFGIKTNFYQLLEIGNSIPTLSVCIRHDILDDYFRDIKPGLKSWKMGDYPIWLYASKNNKIEFLDETLGVYRILPNSASHSVEVNKNLLFLESYRDIRLFFYDYFEINSSSILKHINVQFISDVYRVVMELNGDLSIVKNELMRAKYFNVKLLLIRVALLHKRINKLLFKILLKI